MLKFKQLVLVIVYLEHQHDLSDVQVRRNFAVLDDFIQECLQIELKGKAAVLQKLIAYIVHPSSLIIWKILEYLVKFRERVGGADFLLKLVFLEWWGVRGQDLVQLKEGQLDHALSVSVVRGRVNWDSFTLKDGGEMV